MPDVPFNADTQVEIPADADKESKEIAQEIKDEAGGDDADTTDEEKDESKDESGSDEGKDDDEGEDTDEEDEEGDDSEDADEEDEDEDADEDEDDDDGKPAPLPMWQLRKVEKRLGKQFASQLEGLAQQIREIAGKPAGDKKDEQAGEAAADLAALAEKHGLAPEFVTDLVATLSKRQGEQAKLPDAVTTAVKKLEEKEFWDKEDEQFDDEFASVLKDPEFSDLKDQIKANRQAIYDLAFRNKKYNKYALADIIRLEKDSLFRKGRKSAAGARGGSATSGADLTKPLTDEQIEQLSDAEFDQYSANMAAQSHAHIERAAPKAK